MPRRPRLAAGGLAYHVFNRRVDRIPLFEKPAGYATVETIRVNRPQAASELESLRVSVQRGRRFGDEAWVNRMAKRFGMESTLRARGRPKGS
ncbi:hypothetical protein ACO9S2_17410 [Nitrospira sp. NS4]|uniref:hypothetical protein n=1 Tax=Nitrospira sp. NS4 TaxID=3414498 RepID=UPI003C2EBFDA